MPPKFMNNPPAVRQGDDLENLEVTQIGSDLLEMKLDDLYQVENEALAELKAVELEAEDYRTRDPAEFTAYKDRVTKISALKKYLTEIEAAIYFKNNTVDRNKVDVGIPSTEEIQRLIEANIALLNDTGLPDDERLAILEKNRLLVNLRNNPENHVNTDNLALEEKK